MVNENHKNEALKLLKKHIAIGARKTDEPGKIRSLGTLRNYAQCTSQYLKWRHANGLTRTTQDRKSDLLEYLFMASHKYQQKTLDQHRMALSKAFNKKIEFVKSECQTTVESRIYTPKEVQKILPLLEKKYQISILLCYLCDLRAHELATIKRQNEGERANHRKWHDDLFKHVNDYKIYLVTGKGGLERYIAVPIFLVHALEATRLPATKLVKDRGINYKIIYDVGFGQSLSQIFSAASKKAIGHSNGLHGLRHSYAENRIKTFLRNNDSFELARVIVSQELGHFRPQITNCYIRA